MRDANEMARLYEQEQMCCADIAKRFGISTSTVRRDLIASGFALRERGKATPKGIEQRANKLRGVKRNITPEWCANISKGKRESDAAINAKGVCQTSKGYLRYSKRQDPNYERLVHVVVMEKHIGRRLFPGEVVHHIDEDKQNNDLSNLQLMTNSAHVSLHRAMRKQKATS